MSSPKAEAVIRNFLDESGTATFVQGDVSSEEDTERVVQMALDDYGKIDYLIKLPGLSVLDGGSTRLKNGIKRWLSTYAVSFYYRNLHYLR